MAQPKDVNAYVTAGYDISDTLKFFVGAQYGRSTVKLMREVLS